MSARSTSLLPVYEHERLQALRPYRVLGTPNQPLFNDLVSVVAKVFDVPVAVLALVRAAAGPGADTDTGAGCAAAAAPADGLCAVAVRQTSRALFKALAAEPVLLLNPFVARQLQLPFYAAQCLRAPDGQPVGTLALLGTAPRQLVPAEADLLDRLVLVAQDLLLLPAALAPALRTRLDGRLHESLTRIEILTQLGEWEAHHDAADALPYAAARLHEARHLAFGLHQELLAALAPAGPGPAARAGAQPGRRWLR